MKAVVHIQGRQFTVQAGDIFPVNRFQDKQAGDTLSLSEVLLTANGNETKVGSPYVPGASISLSILENKRGVKLCVFKKKRRKGYRRKQGHRQELSVIKINSINA